MRVISVINQKGGVGKTTTVLNLGHALALGGHRVLAIDLDPQAHLTDSLGLHAYQAGGADNVLLDGDKVGPNLLAIRERMALIPAGGRLGNLESQSGGVERGWRLFRALKSVEGEYDFVLVDCPPSAGLLTMNALLASNELLIPVSSDYLSLSGLSKLMAILEQMEKVLAKQTRKWVAVTRFQRNRRLAKEVYEKLQGYFPDSLLATPIRENVALAESPSYGETIFEYQKRSYGAEDYMSLAADLLHGRVLGGTMAIEDDAVVRTVETQLV